jgi:endonuclease-8
VPEGDTVWLTAHRLHQALAGRELTVFELRVPQLATADLRGATVTEVVARGKHLLVRVDTGLTLHSHLKMDGSWYVTRAGSRPRRYPEHLIRARLGNPEWLATGYRVHDLRIVATVDEAVLVGHLGPDLLGADWDPDEAVRRLRAEADVVIGEALLDQRKLAGIGNLYKSEVLFLAGIHPWTAVADVANLDKVIDLSRRLLVANRDRDEQITTGNRRRGEQTWVYGRAGKPCRRCGTTIRRADQGPAGRERVTFWCESCQTGPAAMPAAISPA